MKLFSFIIDFIKLILNYMDVMSVMERMKVKSYHLDNPITTIEEFRIQFVNFLTKYKINDLRIKEKVK